MRYLIAIVAAYAVTLPAFASPAVPEIDGTLVVQVVALAGGLALMFKRKKR